LLPRRESRAPRGAGGTRRAARSHPRVHARRRRRAADASEHRLPRRHPLAAPPARALGGTMRRATSVVASVVAVAVAVVSAHATELPANVREQLESAKYVYIATQRKDGSYGKAAEIWFLYHDGAVWVGSPPTTWRVKRINHHRPNAKIAVGKP